MRRRESAARSPGGVEALPQLIGRYRGKLVLEATAVAVATGIRALADADGTDVQTALTRYLTSE